MIIFYFLSSIKIEGTLFYKYGTIYREVFHLNKIDVCRALNNEFPDNVIVTIVMKVAKDSLPPGLLHPCPYKVSC